MKVILKEEEEAEKFFNELVNRVVDRMLHKFEARIKELQKQANNEREELWTSKEEAKKILGVKCNKKMQFLRDHNLIRCSQHGKIIRYYVPSLFEFLEENVVK